MSRTGALPPEGLITGRAVPTALRSEALIPSRLAKVCLHWIKGRATHRHSQSAA